MIAVLWLISEMDLGLCDSYSVVDFRNGLCGCVIAVPWLMSKLDFGAVR